MMGELVSFRYYAYQPRLDVRYHTEMKTVPIVGDIIHLPPEAICAITKKAKGRAFILSSGLAFRVVAREKYIKDVLGLDWRISLELTTPIEENEASFEVENTAKK